VIEQTHQLKSSWDESQRTLTDSLATPV